MADITLERSLADKEVAASADETSLRELVTITVDSMEALDPLRASGMPPIAECVNVTPTPTSVTQRLEGTVVAGKYELLRLIARGGMGRVYLARHLELQTSAAVKIMHDHYAANAEHVGRFRREAFAVSCLDHANILKVLDFGKLGETFFIAMEYIDGESLSEWLDAQSSLPSLAAIAPILTQTLDALIHAHEAGIVHRDLKPDNILLARDDGGAVRVKVVDFGLAGSPEATPGGRPEHRAGAVSGTPAYMSPEQCRAIDVSHSTDLYAWGCILTEMLQLEPPFQGDSVRDVILKHILDPVPELNRPADAEPIPAALEHLRRELLSKVPSERPATARVVRERFLGSLA